MKKLTKGFIKRNGRIKPSYGSHHENYEVDLKKDPKKLDGIDILIRDVIELLNKKGYYTTFSCSGHLGNQVKREGKRIVTYYGFPYILFSKEAKKFDIYPAGWYLDEKDLFEGDVVLRVPSKKYMRNMRNTSLNKKAEYMKFYLNNLIKWAEWLP